MLLLSERLETLVIYVSQLVQREITQTELVVRAKSRLEHGGIGRRVSVSIYAAQSWIGLVKGAAVRASVVMAGGACGVPVTAKLRLQKKALPSAIAADLLRITPLNSAAVGPGTRTVLRDARLRPPPPPPVPPPPPDPPLPEPPLPEPGPLAYSGLVFMLSVSTI